MSAEHGRGTARPGQGPDDEQARTGGDAGGGGAAGSGTGPDRPADADDAARLALARAREAARDKGLRPGMAGTRRRRPSIAPPGTTPATARDPQLLGDTTADLSRTLGWNQPLSIAGVIGRWPDVVGEQVAQNCTPETFIDGDLVVRAHSTAWATQIRLLLPQLQRRLAEEVGEGVVTSIQVLGPGGPTWRKGPRHIRGRGPRDTYG